MKRTLLTDGIQRRATWIGLPVVVLFCLWIGWPYFHSIVIRDAAVTSWLNVATAPIAGDLDAGLPGPGQIVGADGRLARIVNPRADRTALERTAGELAAAEARVTQLQKNNSARQTITAAYSAGLKEELDIRVRNQTSDLVYLRQRIKTERADATRISQLNEAGSASTAAAEAAAARVAALEEQRLTLESAIARNQLRRRSADQGVNLLEDGSPSDWVGWIDLLRAGDELTAAQFTLATARQVAGAARRNYDEEQSAALTAPAGSLVWTRYASPGADVISGAPVSAWVDPSELLVDVPLSDVEAALLAPGARAHVAIEGERGTRAGVVLFTRGSAAALGQRDLAALAKGRKPGQAQALVRLVAGPEDRRQSPIGRAADVDFPDLSIFTIIRFRLRL